MSDLAMAFERTGDGTRLVARTRTPDDPGPGELRVRVVAAGVARADLEAGTREDAEGLVPGHDFAGVVDALGPGGAGDLRRGDKVWGTCRPAPGRAGSFAETVCVPAESVGPVPAKLLFEEAAAVPHAACAAYEALAALRPARGRAVLVHGAGGGVGHFAVQLVKNAGLRVFGTARFAKHAFLAAYGVEGMLDRSHPGWAEMLKSAVAEGFVAVLDTVGGLATTSDPLLADDGAYVGFADAGHGVELDTTARRGSLAALAAEIDAKRIRPHVDKIYPFAEAATALEKLASGDVKGKLVLAR